MVGVCLVVKDWSAGLGTGQSVGLFILHISGPSYLQAGRAGRQEMPGGP